MARLNLFFCTRYRALFASVFLTIAGIIFWSAHQPSGPPPALWQPMRPPSYDLKEYVPPQLNSTKPGGVKVIGLVFYGRKEFVSILDCYLKV